MTATGKDILEIARMHVGERYILGASVPKDNPAWKGPRDCAEFATWCVFQASQKLYGCNSDSCEPAGADAYTGYWGRDVAKLGIRISPDQAAATPGAMVLRNPGDKTGHIVISDGKGGTIEAHSTARGVIAGTLDKRRWDAGILIPWIEYEQLAITQPPAAPGTIYRLTKPPMHGSKVLEIQKALRRRRINPGEPDGIFGSHTAAAVRAFQLSKGLVADGEVGSSTAAALGVKIQ